MAKHTPGPWQYQHGFLTVFTCSHGATGITQAIAAPLDGNGDFDSAVMEANARLIAAAPDMLAALKMAERWMEDGVAREAVRAAIAKAEGNA